MDGMKPVVAVATVAACVTLLQLRMASRRRSQKREQELQEEAAEHLEAEEKASTQPLHKFAITGGPCGGKTTALARLATFFRERGFRVFTVPEAATMLFTNGATFRDLETPEREMEFQITLMNLQLFLEDTYERIARSTGRPCILLCDRGAMDGSAYISSDTWQNLLRNTGRDVISLRDGRYNAIFHLMTAAIGAESFYTLENNVARLETLDEARDLDKRLRDAWVGHPKLFVFDNETDFEGKMQRLVQQAGALVGLPMTTKATFKFVLRGVPDPSTFPVHSETFEVEKTYVLTRQRSEDRNVSRQEYSFVRRRSQNGLSAYGQTTVRVGADGQKLEVKRIITAREYAYAVSQRADPDRHCVRQVRTSFLWNNCSYTIHRYVTPNPDLCLLYCQQNAASADHVQLPDFLDVEGEADAEGAHSAYHISLKRAPAPSPPISPRMHR